MFDRGDIGGGAERCGPSGLAVLDRISLRALRDLVTGFASAFEVATVPPGSLQASVADVATIEHAAAAVKSLLAGRLAETDRWREQGFRDPAEQLASLTGSSVGRSREAIRTGQRLERLGAPGEAARRVKAQGVV